MPIKNARLGLNFTCALLLGTSMLALNAAYAEETESDVIDLGLIVVEAQKREELAKDVPVSVKQFDAEQIENFSIENTKDVIAKTPNVAVRTGANGLDTQISIRGIGPIIPFSDSSVPVFVDGVPVPASQAMTLLKNVESVEVLRGPQSTFFGQNSVAGAINIRSRLPDAERRLSASVGIGTRGHYQSDLHASGALVEDRVYGGLTLSASKGDGFVKNALQGGTVDDYNSLMARGNLIFTPNSDLEIRLSGDIVKEKRPARYYSIRPTYSVSSNLDLKDQNDSMGAAATVIYNADGFEVRSLSNFRETIIDNLFNAPMQMDSIERIASQEFRISSNDEDSRLKWMGALYFADEISDVDQDAPIFFSRWNTDLHSKRVAVYGQLGYDFTDRWNVAIGGRLSHVKRSADQVYTNTFPGFGFTNSFTFEETFTGFSPKISTVYKLTDDMNVYANISSGFKPGTLNYGAMSPVNAELESETSTNFEVGVKGTALNDRFSYALSAFYIRSKDYQAYDTAFQSINLDRTESKGFEAEISALLTPYWRIDGSLGYSKTEIKESSEAAYIGNEFPTSPNWTARLASSYHHDLSEELSANLSAEMTYQSDMWGTLLNEDAVKVDGYALVNASAAFEYKNLTLQLQGKNLFDKKYAAEISSAGFWSPGERRSFMATLKAEF